ncbi:hypothetical protein L1049_017474 [Liquidambar formosana]|uniref:hAT-like transposase RNase-H fold domain-containing protein n=1 Tax=Liquidambar formosana TaxID=63359 RepID=A0AAP0S4A8_LIQFO
MKRKFKKYWGNFDNSNMLLYVVVVLDPRYKLKYLKFWVGTCCEATKSKELLKKIKDALTHLYWGNFDNSNMLLYVVVVLDPRYKMKYLKFWVGTCCEATKSKELLKKIKDALTHLYDWYLENNASTIVQEKSSSQTMASESAFSMGGCIIDPFCSNLSPNMVEALICTQNWIRASSTTIGLRDGMDEVEEYEQLEGDLVDMIVVERTVITD